MRFDGGWIKIHRALDNHWIGSDGFALSVFIKLLLWANIKPSKYTESGQVKILERGQLITSLHEIAASFRIDGPSVKTIERKLKLFEAEGAIVQKVTNKGRIITICNYSDYQDYENEPDKQKTSKRQTSDKQVTNERHINEEYKQLKKERMKEECVTADPSGSPEPISNLPKKESETSETWKAYSKAYEQTYRVAPVRNATVNAQMANFVRRVGIEEAPKIAEFYLTHRNKYYIAKMHPVGLLLQDAEKLRTEWMVGFQMTNRIADQTDTASTIDQVFAQYMKKTWGENEG